MQGVYWLAWFTPIADSRALPRNTLTPPRLAALTPALFAALTPLSLARARGMVLGVWVLSFCAGLGAVGTELIGAQLTGMLSGVGTRPAQACPPCTRGDRL